MMLSWVRKSRSNEIAVPSSTLHKRLERFQVIAIAAAEHLDPRPFSDSGALTCDSVVSYII